MALELIEIRLLYGLLDLLICEYILWKQRLEVAQQLLIFQTWIINNASRILLAICLIEETVLRDFHLFFDHLRWRNRILWKQLPYLRLIILKSFVLIDVEEFTKLRKVVQRFLKLDAPVDVEARMSDFEQVFRCHLGDSEQVE